MGADTVKIFCPKCQCVYHPPPVRSRSSHHGGAGVAGVDGAAFSTTFPHLFLMTFSNLVPDPLPKDSAYIPRIFGFRVHMSARQRASGGSNTSSSSSASANRQQQQQQANIAENNRRSSSAGRRSLEAKDKIEPSTAIPAEAAQDQAVAGSNPKGGGRKGGTVPNALAATSLVSKQGIEEDGSAKKTKSGKRKNDNESGSSNNNMSKISNGDKRRRKAENWQQQFIAWIKKTKQIPGKSSNLAEQKLSAVTFFVCVWSWMKRSWKYNYKNVCQGSLLWSCSIRSREEVFQTLQ